MNLAAQGIDVQPDGADPVISEAIGPPPADDTVFRWADAFDDAEALVRVMLFVLVAWVIWFAAFWIARVVTQRTEGVADSALVRRLRRPTFFFLTALAAQMAVKSLLVTGGWAATVRQILALAMIGTGIWIILGALAVIRDVVDERFPTDMRDNLRARRVRTQTRIMLRIAGVIVVILGVGWGLMTFESVKQFGASLLTGAGLAGIVVGLAARPTIGNLIAGLQIALSEPIRLDDVLIVEGEWGRVEEITSTYVVVAIWDQRRLIVPLTYFIEKPFQNWTRKTADLLGSVVLHFDYGLPIEDLRAELERVTRADEAWDGRVCVLQVTDATDRSMTVRALVSASDSGSAWDLRCRVREKLITFVRTQHPSCLPRLRATVEGMATDASASE